MTQPEAPNTVELLGRLVARLHAPAPEGCPWCLEQTPVSLAEDLLKEAYELGEAAALDDADRLAEELGDLLLIILGEVELAQQQGRFRLEDVVRRVGEKVIRRHPHIFGDAVASTASDVLRQWESIRRQEQAQPDSILASVPRAMPALLRAEEVQQRAAAVGFDWPDLAGVEAKIEEELAELRTATAGDRQKEELGDVLLAIANLGRKLGISSERALHEAVDKFGQRFRAIEAECRAMGVRPEDLTLEQLDALWNQAKEREGTSSSGGSS